MLINMKRNVHFFVMLLLITNCANGQKQIIDPAYDSYLAHIAAANASLRLFDGVEAKRWLESAPEKFRGCEWNYLNNAIAGFDKQINLPIEMVDIAISNNGKVLSASGANGQIYFYDVNSFEVINKITASEEALYATAFFEHDTKMVSVAHDFTLKVWDVNSNILLWAKQTKAQGICDIAASPDGNLVALSSWNRIDGNEIGFVQVYDAFTGALIWESNFGAKPLVAIEFSHDGKYLAAAGWNWDVKVWDVTSKEEKYTFNFDETLDYHEIDDLIFSTDDSYLMATSKNSTAKVWNMYTGTIQFDLKGHTNAIYSGAFAQDGSLMFTGCADGNIFLWSTETATIVNKLYGHQGSVNDLVVTPDGKYLFSLSADKTIKQWNIAAKSKYTNPAGQNGNMYAFALSTNSNVLVAQGENGILTEKYLGSFRHLVV